MFDITESRTERLELHRRSQEFMRQLDEQLRQ